MNKPTFETVPVTFESDISQNNQKTDISEKHISESDKWKGKITSILNIIGVDHIYSEQDNYKVIIDFISNLLSQEHNKVLDEVKKEVEEEYESGIYQQEPALLKISTLLEKLKVK